MHRPNVGGRNECKDCYSRGPMDADWKDAFEHVFIWRDLHLKYNRAQYFLDCLVALLQKLGAFDRKQWSHKGVLPVRRPNDYVTALYQSTFDPSNYVYAFALRAEFPALNAAMRWGNGANQETCGDIIECTLALADGGCADMYCGISVQRLAEFLREVSYAVWRVWRVVDWHKFTTGASADSGAGLLRWRPRTLDAACEPRLAPMCDYCDAVAGSNCSMCERRVCGLHCCVVSEPCAHLECNRCSLDLVRT